MASNSTAVGLIGLGAIGSVVADALENNELAAAHLVAVLVRNVEAAKNKVDDGVLVTDDLDAFLAAGPKLVVEVAGQAAVVSYGEPVLAAGSDFLVSSMGAFTDDELYEGLCAVAAGDGGGRLLLASGAMPAVDWLSAASWGHKEGADVEVSVTQAKPVASWRGLPRVDELLAAAGKPAIDDLTELTIFFDGVARDSARLFPKSSNVTAMLALATAGLDQTRVKLAADPTADTMHTTVDYDGPAGTLHLTWSGHPSEANPSTSADVPLAMIKAIQNATGPTVLGA